MTVRVLFFLFSIYLFRLAINGLVDNEVLDTLTRSYPGKPDLVYKELEPRKYFFFVFSYFIAGVVFLIAAIFKKK